MAPRTTRLGLLLASCAALTCRYLPIDATGLSCDATHPCPDALSCLAGRCAAASDGGEVDAGTSDAGTVDAGSSCSEVKPTSASAVAVGHGRDLAAGCGLVVVGDQAGDRLQVVDLATDRVSKNLPLTVDPAAVVLTGEVAWVSTLNSPAVQRVELTSGSTSPVTLPGLVSALGLRGDTPVVAFVEGTIVTRTQFALLAPSGAGLVARTTSGAVPETSLLVHDVVHDRLVVAGWNPTSLRSYVLDGGVLAQETTRSVTGTTRSMAMSADGRHLALVVGSTTAGFEVLDFDPVRLEQQGKWVANDDPMAVAFVGGRLVVAERSGVSTFDPDAHVLRDLISLPSTPQCAPVVVRRIVGSPGQTQVFLLADCGQSLTQSLVIRAPLP